MWWGFTIAVMTKGQNWYS